MVQPNPGVIYTKSQAKDMEHGGFAADDGHVALLVSLPSMEQKIVTRHVKTTQVAPTVVKALGLDPRLLQSVRKEGTHVLPHRDFRRGRRRLTGLGRASRPFDLTVARMACCQSGLAHPYPSSAGRSGSAGWRATESIHIDLCGYVRRQRMHPQTQYRGTFVSIQGIVFTLSRRVIKIRVYPTWTLYGIEPHVSRPRAPVG